MIFHPGTAESGFRLTKKDLKADSVVFSAAMYANPRADMPGFRNAKAED